MEALGSGQAQGQQREIPAPHPSLTAETRPSLARVPFLEGLAVTPSAQAWPPTCPSRNILNKWLLEPSSLQSRIKSSSSGWIPPSLLSSLCLLSPSYHDTFSKLFILVM